MYVPNSKSFLDTEAEVKHVRRHAQFQKHREAICHNFYFPQGKAPKEIHAILKGTLGEHETYSANVKN
jgi:hypothetical protein